MNLKSKYGIHVTDEHKHLKYNEIINMNFKTKGLMTDILSNKEEYFFNKKVMLQVTKSVNLSESSTNQFRNSPHRMLAITLTDGHSKIMAIEHVSCNKLILKKLIPGSKIILHNIPSLVDNIIFLKPTYIVSIGIGQVEALSLSYQMKQDHLAQKQFLASLEENEEKPPAFMKWSVGNKHYTLGTNGVKSEKQNQKPKKKAPVLTKSLQF